MCGIAGIFRAGGAAQNALVQVRAMSEALRHRGPDAQEFWSDLDAGIALGHRRLSIIDLSPAGAQPMTSADGRYVIVYNGEFYNVDEMSAHLPDTGALRGHSDTEVFLELVAATSIEKALSLANGIFAFALWDRKTRKLHLARDRIGVKPLYYAPVGETILFGSELKALTAHPDFPRRIDRNALAAYLRFNYIPAPHTVWQSARKLEPGCYLTIDAGGISDPVRYWDFRQIARRGYRNPVSANGEELTDQLHDLLADAVRRQMVSDVPLGAFLSGGIDSSTVTALMQANSTKPIKTFTIGFTEKHYDETGDARAVARHLKTDHTELRVSPDDALAVVPKLATIYDEPFSDSSQIPTYLVSHLARQSVTVALSGDGGDEFFAGYRRHWVGDQFSRRMGRVPLPLRRGMAAAIRLPEPQSWDKLFKLIPSKVRPRLPGASMEKLASVLALNGGSDIYRQLISSINEPCLFIRGAVEPLGLAWDESFTADIRATLDRMQTLDALTYLPDDILAKVDRASMAVSLEARVPLLDHRIAEFAVRLPREMRLRGGRGKWLLRNVLARHVPRSLFERPKTGFGIPVGEWLRGPLRDWAEDLLNDTALAADDLLNQQPVRDLWQQHQSCNYDHTSALWSILMLQAWRREWT